MNTQWLVIAKAPVPGRVKTRLCPPCTPEQAAALAAAALADTLVAVDDASAASAVNATSVDGASGGVAAPARRVLVLSGECAVPDGWQVVPQRGDGLGTRLHHAFQDTWSPGVASLLLGMDTPQVTPSLLEAAAVTLSAPRVDAVLGPAADGGWWALGLREPAPAAVLRHVSMSTAHTGAETLAALRQRGLNVALLPTLRDVDTVEDAHAVVRQCDPDSRFGRAVAANLPAEAQR